METGRVWEEAGVSPEEDKCNDHGELAMLRVFHQTVETMHTLQYVASHIIYNTVNYIEPTQLFMNKLLGETSVYTVNNPYQVQV